MFYKCETCDGFGYTGWFLPKRCPDCKGDGHARPPKSSGRPPVPPPPPPKKYPAVRVIVGSLLLLLSAASAFAQPLTQRAVSAAPGAMSGVVGQPSPAREAADRADREEFWRVQRALEDVAIRAKRATPRRRSARSLRLMAAPQVESTLFTPERVAALGGLYADGHPWATFAEQFAGWDPPPYGDMGDWDITAYLMTGDPKHARAAIEHLIPRDPQAVAWFAEEPPNRNWSREYGWYFPAIYPVLKPHMTADERADYESRLHSWAKHALEATRASDSDEVVGHYMLLALTDKAIGSRYLEADVETAGSVTSPADMRRQIKRFCEQAKGGEWIESSQYNLGTLQILLMGSATLGLDELPEVKALLPELAAQLRWQLTPDLTQATEWGDIEGGGHNLHVHARIPLMAMVIGLGGDRDGKLSHTLAALMQRTGGPYAYYIGLTRAMWVLDPRTLPDEPQAENPQGLRLAEGAGLAIYRQGETLVQIHSPPRWDVDHQPPYATDIRIWHKDHWLIDHPLAYAGPAEDQNTALFAGIGAMRQSGTVEAHEVGGGFHVEAATSGPYYDPQSFAEAPPPFVNWKRQYDGRSGLLVVTDEFSGEPPYRLGRYYEAAAMRAAWSLWQQVWHAPTEPKLVDGVWHWTSAGGEPLRLATNAPKAAVVPDPAERTGFILRLGSDQRDTVIQTAIAWDGVALPAIEPAPSPKPLKATSPDSTWLPDAGAVVDDSGATWTIAGGRLLRNGWVIIDAPYPENSVLRALWRSGRLVYQANGPYWYDLELGSIPAPGDVPEPVPMPEPEPEPQPSEPKLLNEYRKGDRIFRAYEDRLEQVRIEQRPTEVIVESIPAIAP